MSVKVGVIIPSYNQGKYIEKTILSVIANRKNINIDIAVIDGDSEDKSCEIIRKYEKDLKYWCSEKDKGQADAINKGIAVLSDCDYYMWLNSDDVFEDEFAVKKIVDYAVEKELEVCYGLSHFIDEEDRIIGEYPVEEYSYKKLGSHCFLSQPSVMFSRKAFETVGPLNVKLKMCLDYEYWIRLAQKYEFGFLREFIGSTRIYADTKTATMQKTHLKEAINILWKYYGNVPIHWLVTRKLSEKPKNNLIHKVPKRILMLFYYPQKKKMIKECLEGIYND